MAWIRPFCALRYDPTHIEDLSRVIAPPYDVIDADEQDRLYRTSPYNIVRLILGKRSPSDTPQENSYTRARRAFDTWCVQGVLRRDAAPAFYIVEHAFVDDDRQPRRRLGFTALLELEASPEGVILRHEHTLEAPTADRLQLLDALPANLSPIFCVYPDADQAVQPLLRDVASTDPPDAEATLNGEALRLWVVTDPHVIDAMVRRLVPIAVLIADGHHRFEAAYARRTRYGAVMAHFVSMADPALIVRPIHRIICGQGPIDLGALGQISRLEPAHDSASVMRWLRGVEDQGCFGFYAHGRLYRVSLHPDEVAHWLLAASAQLPLATLDVCLLHGVILPHLGFNRAAIRYTTDPDQAFQEVDRGEGNMAWLLRGIPLTQVYALAAQGLMLPPKSTSFYPKVPSGLTLNPFE